MDRERESEKVQSVCDQLTLNTRERREMKVKGGSTASSEVFASMFHIT